MKEGWTYKKLGDIATEMYRGSGIKREQITTSGFPCVRYGEIYTTYNISFEKCESHTIEESITPRKYFEHGDLLFAITGESVEDIGKTVAYLGHEKCLLGGDIVCMKHNENPKYLSYALSSKEAIRQKGLGKTKLKVVHTNIPSLKEIVIPVPPISEQHSIVSFLDAAFAHIDALKANAEKQLAEARQLFQVELAECMKPKEGWEEKTLKSICKINSGKSIKADLIVPVTSNDVLVPCYGGNGLRGYVSEANCAGLNPIIGRVGAQCGNIHYSQEPFYATEHALVVTLLDDDVNPLWLCRQLEYMDLKQYAEGAAQPVIAAGRLLGLIIAIPPLIEQQKIVSRLDALSSNIKKLEEVQRKTVAECDALKQAMLREVFE